jgi:two-component system OmpR family response regulator
MMSIVGTADMIYGTASLRDAPVAILHWPEEADQLGALARTGHLRLLLVAPEVTPPTEWDSCTDWIRLPAPDDDIRQRVLGLQLRARRLPPPHLDEYGVLRREPLWVCLSPVEARLLAMLLEKPGSVCSRQSLAVSGWSDASQDTNSITAAIKRVRDRVAPLGLAIRTVRQRGYFLEIDPQANIDDQQRTAASAR